jgi:hypothetical protein
LPPFEVDILHANCHRFKQSKAASVKKLANEANGRGEVFEQGDHLLAREHRREVVRPTGTFERFEPGNLQIEDAFVEEEQGTKSLILHGRRSTAFHGQFVQVCGAFLQRPSAVDVFLCESG